METLEMINLFDGIYKNKTVLITGNSGFKGSWLALWLQALGANVVGYSIDEISSPSHFSLLKLKYKTHFKDILDRKSLETVFKKHKPEIVFHLAAQSLVRDSYKNPVETYEVNVLGTLNVFEAARRSGSVKAIVNVTTDKVYENIEKDVSYKETDRLGGFDLYSSSKACSEILSASYRRAFFSDYKTLITTARAGNVIGGGDWASDRLIPDLIRSVQAGSPAEIRNSSSIRPWQHVLEPLSGYLLLGQKLLSGEKAAASSWNFGPQEENCVQVSDLIGKMRSNWTDLKYRIPHNATTNMHEAGILKLDFRHSKKELGWNPVWGIDKTVEKTSNWYKAYFKNKSICSLKDLEEYIDDARKLKLVWCK